jgi:hypothetical protein
MVWLGGINLNFKMSLLFCGGFLLFMFVATFFASNNGLAFDGVL